MSSIPARPVRRGCGVSPFECLRDHVAPKLSDAKNNGDQKWRWKARCPVCDKGGFSIETGTKGDHPPRIIWFCNASRCHKQKIRDALAELIGAEHLGWFGTPESQDDDTIRWADVDALLQDPTICANDLKWRIRELHDGPAPAGKAEFVEFATRAGVSKAGAYEAERRRRGLPPRGASPQRKYLRGEQNACQVVQISAFQDSGIQTPRRSRFWNPERRQSGIQTYGA